MVSAKARQNILVEGLTEALAFMLWHGASLAIENLLARVRSESKRLRLAKTDDGNAF